MRTVLNDIEESEIRNRKSPIAYRPTDLNIRSLPRIIELPGSGSDMNAINANAAATIAAAMGAIVFLIKSR